MFVDLFLIPIDNISALVYNKSATIKEREEPMKKILTALLLTLLILGMTLAFISCDKTPDTPPAESDSDSLPDDSESSTDQVTDEVIDLAEHKIIENGVVNYSVVRAESASSELVAGITALYDFLAPKSSQLVTYETDFSLDYLTTGKHDANKLEIVIGNTNYEKSADLVKSLTYGEYLIQPSGNKIYLVSATEEGVEAAVNKLISIFDSLYDGAVGQLTVSSADLSCKGVFNETLAEIPAIDNGQFDFSKDGGDGSQMLVFKGTSADDYAKYSTKLTEMGYKEYMRNDNFGDNKFVMFTKDDVAVNVLYTKKDSTTRIIMDDLTKTDLPEIDADYASTQKKCDSLLIQIGVVPKDNNKNNGECYLVRCEDGRFIVMDGGFATNEADTSPRDNARRIYETIVKFTPPGMEPTIACWIITHAHGDHVGALGTFLKNYSTLVQIDQFAYNYPLKNLDDKSWPGRENFRNTINTYYKDADIVKPHTGQTFQYANVKMEFLYTVELLWPGKLRDTINNASLVTRFCIYDQTMLMPGDMGPDANPICVKYNGNYLKSDFYHVTHHGYAGGSNEFNKLVSPTWVLWPVSEDAYNEVKGSSRNDWLSDPNSSVKQIFPAWFQTTTFNLPFDGTNYTVTPNT